MKPEFMSEDKLEYYSYILCYVDDILCIHHHPDDVLNKLNGCVSFKCGSVRIPDMYLGTKLKHMQLYNGIWAWSVSPSKFFQEAGRICEKYVTKHLSKGYQLPSRAEYPFTVAIAPNLMRLRYWNQMRHLLPVFYRSNEVDDQNRLNLYKY